MLFNSVHASYRRILFLHSLLLFQKSYAFTDLITRIVFFFFNRYITYGPLAIFAYLWSYWSCELLVSEQY